MSQEEQNNKTLVPNIESLLVSTETTPHEIAVDPDNPDVILRVWVKELSFLQTQKAVAEVVQLRPDGQVNIDLANYWKYMMGECIDRTEPEMSKAQIYALKSEVANQIIALLPQPQDLVAGPLEDGLTA